MPSRKRVRPSARRDEGDDLKLHRRAVRADGRDLTVVTLRPGHAARFSTNRYHGTWHVLTCPRGARLLGRLLWGLSFQRVPGTVVVIGAPHLEPNPFDAEPSDPIVLVPAGLTILTPRAARVLRAKAFAPPPSEGTVRWRTWGLDAALDRRREEQSRPRWWTTRWERPADERLTAVERAGGTLVLRGSAAQLRTWATWVWELSERMYDGSNHVYLDGWNHGHEGEVQVFTDYRRRADAAAVARREILARHSAPPLPADLNPLVWEHGAAVRARARRGAGAVPAASEPA
ncbi:hypothetical protein [Bailinhaonella thermotolerans]|uniref:Uncharacterized protein n=1 Tax=Bailinhaonella thermotolerans TaxID=1070861 RepID=A0A3A4ATJ6_9ACTN|nr:hypothetical protein [Bailinhaonella thermotolerans]RJL32713.1 hypothetical protein D5H75_14610 [Bailinhaonella thermotolerans]